MMNEKISEGIGKLLVGTFLVGVAGAVAGLLYQGCIKKNTLEDVTVTNERNLKYCYYETGNDYYIKRIKLDNYAGELIFDDPVKVGDEFKRITYRNNFLSVPRVTEYERK